MKYVLGVCGSVSAYKACDILRGLTKKGHEVKVIVTKGAERFIPKEQFSYLGAQAVYSWDDDFKTKEKSILHIDLKHWLDRLIIAPASANTLAKLACGQCDDLLSSVFLSCGEAEKILFPAMNTSMLHNFITQDNFKRLQSLPKCFIHPTGSGVLACGDEGEGKLPLPDDIVDFLESFSFDVTKKSALITTGATKAPLDPVRYMTNPSSGKTGIEIAKTFLRNGHKVTLVAGEETMVPLGLQNNPNLELHKVVTTEHMLNTVEEKFPLCDVYISAAAIGDIKFKTTSSKLKKSSSDQTIEFEWDHDILKAVLSKRKHQRIISFAAESEITEKVIQEKFERKPVDLMIVNQVSNGSSKPQQGFGMDKNEYILVKEGKTIDKMNITKAELAENIFNEVLKLW